MDHTAPRGIPGPATWILLAAVAALLVGCARTAPRGSGAGSGTSPVIGTPAAPGSSGAPQVVVPHPGMTDPRPFGWDRAVPSSDGRSVTVYFWSAPCDGLDRVDTRATPGKVIITLLVGANPALAQSPCPQVAVSRAVRVSLPRPLSGAKLVDGARGEPAVPPGDAASGSPPGT
jgi:hypothetical protein